MSKMNGFEVLEEMQKNLFLVKIPVVVLSTSKDPEDIERAYRLGAKVFWAKPDSFPSWVALARKFVSPRFLGHIN